ncbi:amidohydrolase family protein [Bosea sp. FBZP-16]|uniref:N-acetylglucosamine-6-phosphate deacetylase n=1 Tax=Bosea sp. FBZP-16 TaxID=2065382 RepID=UPI000C30628D|nr:amidohydrolase family protein [Bosea sp. FBZP-16]
MPTSPGLVDLQINGFAGVDFNDPAITPADLDRALEAMLATGVTQCLPTIITAHPHELVERFQALDKAVAESRLGPLMCPGYHLEGPFLNPAPGYHGCHPPQAMTAARPELIAEVERGLSRPILMVTLAPEREGAIRLTKSLAEAGKIVAVGHSAADFDQVSAAADVGLSLSTHLGNGLPQSLHKLANPIFAQLAEDRLMAGFIADGIHVHPKALAALIRAKGLERSILVTDAVVAAAAPIGRYHFAGMAVDRMPDGSVRQEAGLLAGSALCLDEAVRNVVSWGIATPAQAFAMASDHALAAIRPALAAHGLVLAEGEVEWSDELFIRRVRLADQERHYDA